MPPLGRIERADPHQAVHASLAGKIPVCVRPGDVQRRRADAGFLAVQAVDLLDLVAAPLEESQVHPQEHLGPVAAFGPAGAGVDGHVAVARVVLAGEHRSQFQPVEVGGDFFGLAGRLAERINVVGLGAQFVQRLKVLDATEYFRYRHDDGLECLELGDDFLCRFLVGPEIRPGHLLLDPGHLLHARRQVKESPGWLRSGR